MLKPGQLSIARMAVDVMYSLATRYKFCMQVARLNGLDETTIVTSIGTVDMPWIGRVSRSVPTETRLEKLPVDWDKAKEVNGLLVHSDNYDPGQEEHTLLIAEAMRAEMDSGVIGLDVLSCRGEFKYIVTSGHSIYLVRTTADGTNDAQWVNSRKELPNLVLIVRESHTKLMSSILAMDEDASVGMSKHQSGVGIMHIISNKLKVAVNICMPNPGKGSVIHINKNLRTSEITAGTFEKLIEKGKEVMSSDVKPVEMDQLMQLAGMANNTVGGGIVKPKEEEAPFDTNPQSAPSVVDKPATQQATQQVTQPVTATPVVKPTEQAAANTEETSVLEDLDALIVVFEEREKQYREDKNKLRALRKKVAAEERAKKTKKPDKSKEEIKNELLKEMKIYLEDKFK